MPRICFPLNALLLPVGKSRNFDLAVQVLGQAKRKQIFVVLALDKSKSKTSFYLDLFSLIRNSELRSKLLPLGKSKLKTSFYLLFRSLIRNSDLRFAPVEVLGQAKRNKFRDPFAREKQIKASFICFSAHLFVTL